MSAANIRLANKEQSLTAVARKVLEAVPISEAWTVQLIYQELARLGHNIEARTIGGCLDDLVEKGLVRQPQTGRYQRIAHKEERPTLHQITGYSADVPRPQAPVVALKENDSEDPLAMIGRLAEEVRIRLAAIEDAAVALSDQIRDAKEKGDAFDKMRALMGFGSK